MYIHSHIHITCEVHISFFYSSSGYVLLYIYRLNEREYSSMTRIVPVTFTAVTKWSVTL